MPPPQKMAKT